jgi:hypothetical protein
VPIMDKIIHPCQTAFIKCKYYWWGCFVTRGAKGSKVQEATWVVLKIDF